MKRFCPPIFHYVVMALFCSAIHMAVSGEDIQGKAVLLGMNIEVIAINHIGENNILVLGLRQVDLSCNRTGFKIPLLIEVTKTGEVIRTKRFPNLVSSGSDGQVIRTKDGFFLAQTQATDRNEQTTTNCQPNFSFKMLELKFSGWRDLFPEFDGIVRSVIPIGDNPTQFYVMEQPHQAPPSRITRVDIDSEVLWTKPFKKYVRAAAVDLDGNLLLIVSVRKQSELIKLSSEGDELSSTIHNLISNDVQILRSPTNFLVVQKFGYPGYSGLPVIALQEEARTMDFLPAGSTISGNSFWATGSYHRHSSITHINQDGTTSNYRLNLGSKYDTATDVLSLKNGMVIVAGNVYDKRRFFPYLAIVDPQQQNTCLFDAKEMTDLERVVHDDLQLNIRQPQQNETPTYTSLKTGMKIDLSAHCESKEEQDYFAVLKKLVKLIPPRPLYSVIQLSMGETYRVQSYDIGGFSSHTRHSRLAIIVSPNTVGEFAEQLTNVFQPHFRRIDHLKDELRALIAIDHVNAYDGPYTVSEGRTIADWNDSVSFERLEETVRLLIDQFEELTEEEKRKIWQLTQPLDLYIYPGSFGMADLYKDENSRTAITYTDVHTFYEHLIDYGESNDTQKQNRPEARTLIEAADDGDLAKVTHLLKSGENANGINNDYLPLQAAARHPNIVDALLNAGANVNRVVRSGTALQSASNYSAIPTINLLLLNGAHTELTDAKGYTPLLAAASRGNSSATKLLIKAGASVAARTYACQETPLHLASGSAPVTKLLLEAGANPLALDCNGATPAHLAAEKWLGYGVLEELSAIGVNFEAKDKEGMRPCDYALRSNQSENVKLLNANLESGCSFESK